MTSPADLRKQYETIQERASKFCDELEKQLSDIIYEQNIILGFPIEKRVKSWDSINEKLSRVKLNIKKINDLQDLIGIRVILLFPRDAELVVNLINQTFNVKKQYNTKDKLKDDQFGYASYHCVIGLPEDWLQIPYMKGFKDLVAEIQVRTLAQHLWSEASHTLQYKNEVNVPRPLLRSMYSISALLEMIDTVFEKLLDDRLSYREEITEEITENIPNNAKLNRDALEIILDNLLPPENKDVNEYYSELLRELNYFGIDTPDKLREFITKHLEEIKRIDKESVQNKMKYKKAFSDDEVSRMKAGVFLTHTGLVRQALDIQYGPDWREIIEY